jgi:catechol 2,3-dioxygenase-like lactoylglutathione lyase family enzyme
MVSAMNRIDHIVINTHDHIDQAVVYFERMGFTVTPRGYHNVGTINNTIVFKTDYLELLEYPADKSMEHLPEFVQPPAGLMATVLKADDADQLRATLMTRGMIPQPVLNLSRPIDLGNGDTANVKFRVVRLERDAVPGTYLYYCQHITPEFVWRPAWQTHANGCIAITRLSINVSDPKAAVEVYSRAMDVVKVEDTEANGCIIHLPSFEITLVNNSDKPLGMFKLVFGTDSLEKVAAALTQGGIYHHKEGERILADTLPHIGCALEFECVIDRA